MYAAFADPTKPTTFSAIFKHISPPTAVENCLYCNLVHPWKKNLVITRGSFIDLYSLKPGNDGENHLSWIYTTCVYEEIADIKSVRFIGDSLDSLLISFKEARVAVMAFDPTQYELKTLSLHNYEFENLKSGRLHFYRPPVLRVDPLQRCAVLLVYDRYLAVMPFRRSETVQLFDKSTPRTMRVSKSGLSWERRATAPLLATFTTCLSSSTGERINNVIDIQFLHGFYEPTLLVLYEPIGTWAGRVSARRDTCCIVALSFNLQKRTNPVIWFQELLPYDCRYVYPVPQPIGGIVILATNSIIYLKQTLPSCGLPLNCYARLTTDFPMRQEVPACGPLTLDGCRALAVNDSQFLIATRTGKLYILSLWVERATQTVSSLLLHELGCAVPPHCLALVGPDYLFIGSRLCDSVLLRCHLNEMTVDTNGKMIGAADEISDPVMIQSALPNGTTEEKTTDNVMDVTPKITNNNSVVAYGPYTFDEVDVELYGEAILNPPSKYRKLNSYIFKLVDRLRNFGPMGLITSGEVPCLAPGNTDPTDEALIAAQAEMQHVELIACIPRSFELGGKNASFDTDQNDELRRGGVLLLHTSVRSRGLTAFELPEYMSLWSLYGPPVVLSHPVTKAESEDRRTSVSETAEISITSMTPSKLEEKQGHIQSMDTDSIVTSIILKPDDMLSTVPASQETESADNEITMKQASGACDMTENGTTTTQPNIKDSSHPGSNNVESEALEDPCIGPQHSYLLLTREDSTMILEVGNEIVELEVSGFNTTEMTVAAINLGGEYISQLKQAKGVDMAPGLFFSSPFEKERCRIDAGDAGNNRIRAGYDYPYILQVSPTSLRLLDGPKLIEYVQVTLEWRIHLASAADPFVLLCTEDDELFLVRLRAPREVDAALASNRTNPKKTYYLDLRSTLDSTEAHAGIFTGPFDSSYAQTASTPRLEIFRPKVRQVSAPACFCLYQDKSGQLARWLWSRPVVSDRAPTSATAGPNSMTTPNTSACEFFPAADAAAFAEMNEKLFQPLTSSEEEDLMLYGQLIELCKRERSEPVNSKQITQETEQQAMDTDAWSTEIGDIRVRSNYFAFILFTNGVLEIYGLPDFVLLYEVHHFSDLPTMLFDHRGMDMDSTVLGGNQSSHTAFEEETMPPSVLEITVFPIGRNLDRPILVARTSQELAFFEALCPAPNETHPLSHDSWLGEGLRWRRLPIPCSLVAPRRVRTDPKIADVHSTLLNRTHMLRPFEDIGGHRGVFACGACPMWIFGTDSGQIRVFPHAIDGVMGSFAPLNTTICPSGFVYFTYSNEMRLATLPPGYSFRENLGMRWIPLELAPYFVQYHVESKTYVVVGTCSEACSSVFRLNSEGNKEEDVLLRPPTCALPPLDHYALQIYAPIVTSKDDRAWLPVPNTRVKFEPWEVVTCMITAHLASEQTFHGTKDYLVIGANLSYGEEIPVRGRIVIFDIIDVVPEPGQPLTRHKLKTLFDGEQKGPVTALTSCQGHLISAIGQKIYIWTLKNSDLVGVAFVDSELYIHNLLCVKNLVLASDVLKSIQLLRFQSDLRVLSVVSRDCIAREVYTSNFFVDGRRLGFLVVDEHGNCVIYSYDPLDPSSRSGRRLVRRADLCLPSVATCSLRVSNRLRHALLSVKPSAHQPAPPATTVPSDSTTSTADASDSATAMSTVGSSNTPKRSATTAAMPVSNPPSSATNPDPDRLRHSIYLGSQNGAIYLLGPIRDKMYSRLRITEKNLIHHLGPTCGMLPKLCWSYRSPNPELANPCGQVADADLLWRYMILPHSQRLEIAKKSGQSLEGIIDDIAELNATTSHF